MMHGSGARLVDLLPVQIICIIFNYYYSAPKILATQDAFYALCVDGTICTHDMSQFGRTIISHDINIESITSNHLACVAISRDGHMLTWGDIDSGGELNADALEAANMNSRRPTSVYPTRYTFSVLFSDGSKVDWGDTKKWRPNLDNLDLSKVDTLFTNDIFFAALMKDKTVQTWRHSPRRRGFKYTHPAELSDVIQISLNRWSFAALLGNGNVVSWGHKDFDLSDKLTHVKRIYSNQAAFAALCEDGSVFTWGTDWFGGDSSGISHELRNVVDICSTDRAFAAIRRDGSVVAWGDEDCGGNIRGELEDEYCGGYIRRVGEVPYIGEVSYICATKEAFAALTRDGQVVTWGNLTYGANSSILGTYPSRQPVTSIHAGRSVFTAISGTKAITWGYLTPRSGTWRPHVNVTDIGFHTPVDVVSVRESFLATTDRGDLVTWGASANSTWGARANNYYLTKIINERQSFIRKAFKNATGMG